VSYRSLLTALACLCVLSAPAVAQSAVKRFPTQVHVEPTADGAVSGKISSPNGACLKGRKLTLLAHATHDSVGTDLTNSSGSWSVDVVPDETIDVQVSKRSTRARVCKAARAGPLDATPPTVAVTPGLEEDGSGTDGSVLYSVGDATSVACTLDGGPVSCDLSGGYSFMSLPDGSHTFVVQGADAVGNTSSADVTWQVDASPPVIVSVTPSNGSTTGTSGQITVGLADASLINEIHCVLDGTDTPCGSGQSGMTSFDSLTPGQHHVEIYGVDKWGNSGSAFAAHTGLPAQRARVDWTVSDGSP
jgi:hypothetical protein